MRKKKILFLVVIICTAIQLQSATNDPGSWWMLMNQTKLTAKWGLHSEIQHRNYSLSPNPEQLLLRGGINWNYNAGTILTAGYGYIVNYQNEGGFSNARTAAEHRTWEQVILRNNVERVFLEHRYRAEQRWITTDNKTIYRNRIRYLLRITVPVNKKELVKNTVFLSAYNEVFLHLNNSHFDRNRLYGALGYQLSNSANVQLGYLFQTVGSSTGQYLQFLINFNPNFSRG